MIPLIQDTAEVKLFASVNASLHIKDLAPSIKRAQTNVIKPLLGAKLLSELEEYYTDSNSSTETDIMDELLEKTQEVIAVFSLVKYVNFGSVQWDSTGITMVFSDDRKPAFQWAVENLRQELILMGDESVNNLLEFLEENVETLPSWTASSAYSQFKELFVQTTTQFQKHFYINDSRTTFIALKPAIREVEDFHIKPVLCDEYFSELKTKLLFIEGDSSSGSTSDPEGGLNPEDEIVLDLIRKAIVPLTVSKALKYLPVQWNNNGIIIRRVAGLSVIKEDPATTNQLSSIQAETEKIGNAYLEELKIYLNKYASETSFPTYFNSTCYQNPEEVSDNNSPKRGGPYNTNGMTMV